MRDDTLEGNPNVGVNLRNIDAISPVIVDWVHNFGWLRSLKATKLETHGSQSIHCSGRRRSWL